jgi:hypothetical protein
MPRYRLLAAAVIDGAVREAGEEIEFDGTPGHHMEPLDAAAKRLKVPSPEPLDPAYLAYAKESGIPGQIMTGFSGFPSGAGPVNVDVPHVSGDGTVGEILTCTMGNWEGEPTEYAYLWESDDEDVGTDGSYLIAASDAGHSITCIVTASNAWGSTTAPPSNAVAVAATRRTGGGSRG